MLKKNLVWIVCALVVIGSAAFYFLVVSGVDDDTDAQRKACQEKADFFKDWAGKAGTPDAIKTARHVAAAVAYGTAVDTQLKSVQDEWKKKKVDVHFDKVPTDSLRFDNWLTDQRNSLEVMANAAKLQLPPDMDKLTFKESTEEHAADITRRRDYRLRQMALVEEIISIFCRARDKQQVLRFEPKKDVQEAIDNVEVGANALEKIEIKDVKTSTERIRQAYEKALLNAGKTVNVKPTDLSYAVTSIEIQFVAPMVVVPKIIKDLESSNRYLGVISKVDFQRASPPFPSQAEVSPAKAGTSPVTPVAMPTQQSFVNSHYKEAPVRVAVTLDLYEYKEAAAAPAAK